MPYYYHEPTDDPDEEELHFIRGCTVLLIFTLWLVGGIVLLSILY